MVFQIFRQSLSSLDPKDKIPIIQENIRKISQTGIHFPPSMSADAQDLISRLLSTDPEKRITSWDEVLAHPFFASPI